MQEKQNFTLDERKIYIVKENKLVGFPSPASGYGQQVVTWVDGKITSVDTNNKHKI